MLPFSLCRALSETARLADYSPQSQAHRATFGNMAAVVPERFCPPPGSSRTSGAMLQRKCACGGSIGPTGECEECRRKRLQRKTVNASASNQEIPSIVHEVLRSPGRPLDAATRAFFEPRFSHDLRHVRVHTDRRAEQSARELDAWAYTVGRNVVFGAGKYAPQTDDGRHLLAHELTHVVQQGVEQPSSFAVSDPSDATEREANDSAQMLADGRIGPSTSRLRTGAAWRATGLRRRLLSCAHLHGRLLAR